MCYHCFSCGLCSLEGNIKSDQTDANSFSPSPFSRCSSSWLTSPHYLLPNAGLFLVRHWWSLVVEGRDMVGTGTAGRLFKCFKLVPLTNDAVIWTLKGDFPGRGRDIYHTGNRGDLFVLRPKLTEEHRVDTPPVICSSSSPLVGDHPFPGPRADDHASD